MSAHDTFRLALPLIGIVLSAAILAYLFFQTDRSDRQRHRIESFIRNYLGRVWVNDHRLKKAIRDSGISMSDKLFSKVMWSLYDSGKIEIAEHEMADDPNGRIQKVLSYRISHSA
ncbi:MAG: hypothetical protein KGI66_00435 [Patescibacteria group bacterium]|nr:hypothetical protein [Patescibacteria group bacterium]